MTLLGVKNLINSVNCPVETWVTPAKDENGEDIDLPFGTLAKPKNSSIVYGDNTVQKVYGVVELYLAMKKDDEASELAMDRKLIENGFEYEYQMYYMPEENIVIKVYTFEIEEDL